MTGRETDDARHEGDANVFCVGGKGDKVIRAFSKKSCEQEEGRMEAEPG